MLFNVKQCLHCYGYNGINTALSFYLKVSSLFKQLHLTLLEYSSLYVLYTNDHSLFFSEIYEFAIHYIQIEKGPPIDIDYAWGPKP